MLFINFLCLLYLMVLIDSRTISKSINSYDRTDDVFDAITDLYYTTNHKLKLNRHKHRRVDKHEVAKPMHSRIHAKLTKHGSPKIYGRDAKVETKESDKTSYPVLTTARVPVKVLEHPKHKSPKPRVGSFWRKFRNKLRKDKQNEISRQRRIYENEDFKQNHYIKRRHNNEEHVLERPKHSADKDTSHATNTGFKKWLFDEKDLNKATTKMKCESRTRNDGVKERNTTPTYVNLTAELDAMTTEILHLKELYAVDKHSTTTIEPPYFEYATQKTSTLYDTEFPGTAQIEELLNDIKARAIQMIAEQSPSITDLISNTVTETTFEADPILAHTEVAVPGYAFSTFVSIHAIDDTFNKRDADITNANEYETESPFLIKNTEPHGMRRRSIKDDAMTIAQSVEYMLQKELKKTLNKAKDKISCEIQKGMHKIRPTTHKPGPYKTTPMNPETKTPMTVTKKIYESTAIKKHRGNKHSKNKGDKARVTDVTSRASTLDDYIMLTLYEQILSKTRDDNMIKVVTGNDPPLRIRRRDKDLLSKRNFETLTDLKLKEDIQKIYDDGVNMPEYDYSVDSIPEDSTEKTEVVSPKTNSTDDQFYDEPRTDAGIEETSYEALSNKIGYNDFVNGYKHYLKFQKDQAHSNFSNMVKYQAHRHHNVDDIGKFILNKIPQLPNRIYKRFFDDSDIEDQEASTKNDDSWFKKHFYFFIDNGPPKKYHTSQTVPLKYPIKASKNKLYVANNDAGEEGIFVNTIVPNESDEKTQLERNSDMNLEELSRNLEGNKRQGTHTLPLLRLTTNQATTVDDNAKRKMFAPRKLIGNFFGGKKRQTLKPKHDINGSKLKEQLNETGRLRRGINDSSMDFDDGKYTNNNYKLGDAQATLLDEHSKKKHGYVNINVVPQPTAIVKLRDSPTKKSKIRNFFKKFRFHKKTTTPKKVKRRLKRRRRFSPIKKIKGLFSVRTDNKPMPPSFNMEDYEMASSHVDGFKPVRYDTPMTIDEMKQQIPNITDVLDDVLLKPATTTGKSGRFTSDFRWAEDYGFLNNQLSNFNVRYNDSIVTASNLVPDVIYTAPPTKKRTTKKNTVKTTQPTQDLQTNINVKSLKSSTERCFQSTTQEVLMTLEDMRNEIDSIQNKLFHYHKLRPITTFGDVLTDHAFKKSTSLPINRVFNTKSTMNPNDHGIHKLATANSNMFTRESNLFPRKHNFNHASKLPTTFSRLNAKPDNKEFIIKGKLTRVAKFPISHHKNADFVQSLDEYVDIDDDPAIDYIQHDGDIDKSGASAAQATTQPFITVTVTQLDNPMKHNDVDSHYKINSDYFNDLLLWHNDILNTDRVTNPIWKRIIDAMDENTYTTPNLVGLASELKEINEYLYTADGGRTTAKNDFIRHANDTHNIGIIKSLAINDKALAENDKVIIEGEAKYLKLNNPITESNLKITSFDDLFGFKDDSIHGVNIIDYRRNTGRPEEPGILVDTTLMAYDDDMDLNGIESKKLSRNSLKSSPEFIKTNPHQLVIAKTNKQPKQYYTTPLPMKSNEFDRFLKQNSLDVESVTSPLNILPSYVDTWSHKSHTPEITSSIKAEGLAVKDDKKTENVTPKLFNIEPVTKDKVITTGDEVVDAKNKPDLDLEDNFDRTRLKRFSGVDAGFNMPNRMDNIRQKKYYDKLKKKMKLFDTKYTRDVADTTKFNEFNNLDLQTNKEVEITIINFDDMNKTPLDSSGLDDNWNKFKSTRNLHAIPESMIVGVTETKLGRPLSHNSLIFKSDTDKPKVVVYSVDSTKPEYVTVGYNSYTKSDTMSDEFFKHLPQFKGMLAPKSVHISGHNYKYDIFYGPDKVGENTFYNHDNFGKIERDIRVGSPTSTVATTSQEPQIIFLPGLANNSEPDYIEKKEMNAMFANKKRQARDVETFNAGVSPVAGSVVYDLKGLDWSTRRVSTKEREKRLFKLLPLIQDKLKCLRRRTSASPEKHSETSVEEATTSETTITSETAMTGKAVKKSKNARRGTRIENSDSCERDSESDYKERRKQPAYSETREVSTNISEDIGNVTPKVDKRDIQNQNTYTAKDVAALEIIVDLMKNTLNFEEKDVPNVYNKNYFQYTTKSVMCSRDPLNSIEVHIAIPYDLQNYNKRSLELEPMRVRKVFSAKMSTPVDLEYQVHSYEGLNEPPTTTTPANSITEGLSPGMYLLVNKSLPNNGYELKPVTAPNNVVENRDTSAVRTMADTAETTAARDGKVTLSKDFIAAVNKQIVELFENVTNIPKRQARQADTNEAKKKIEEHKSTSLWEAIKKFFGHDRVCNCKCKPYTAMCKACAASDAVMEELIFEFDNLANYMKEHCTEIQTFFWMNPTGGKKLKEAVHKIDTSMRDYFKRVKGKCQGQTCKTFSTFIDKRDSKHDRVAKDVGATFVNEVVSLAEDVEKITKVVTCFNQKLKDRSDRMIHAIGNCINAKLYNKRSDTNNTTKRKLIKNVYSLDNINVNIICNPEMSSTTESYDGTLMSLESTLAPHHVINALELSLDEIKRNNKKRKGFRKLFTRKNKLFTYYVTPDLPKMKGKRDATQIEAPLISDSGGTFWYDYIKGKTNEPRIVRETKRKQEPHVGVTVVQTKNELITEEQLTADKINNIVLSVRTSPKTLVEREASTSDLVSHHFNQLLKLFGNMGVNEMRNLNSTAPTVTTKHSGTKNVTCNTKKPKKTKCTKALQKVKDKHCKCNKTCAKGSKCKECKFHKTCTNCTKCKETKHIDSITKPMVTVNSGHTIAMHAITSTSLDISDFTSKQTAKSILNKIIDNLTKGNYLIDEKKLTTVRDDKKRFTPTYSDDYEFKTTKDTAVDNLTIMMMDDLDPTLNEKKTFEDYKNLLLSIIQHETNKLNNEWLNFAYKSRREDSKSKINEKKNNLDITTKPTLNLDYDGIVNSLEDIQVPEPMQNKKPKGLLDKIANKMGMKGLNGSNEKAGKRRHFDIVTRSAVTTGPVTGLEDELQSQDETGDSTPQMCNIQATCKHIRKLYDQLPSNKFENYVKNITCHKYERIKRFFFIEYPSRENRRWDWIRRKRSLNNFDRYSKSNHVQGASNILFNDDEFEKFVKGDDGIYRMRNREKRTVAETKYLDGELRNVAPLKPSPNEIYAMLRDTIVISCTPFKPSIDTEHSCTWKSERRDMLRHNNVVVDGPRITIHNIGIRNDGSYSCMQGARKLSDIRVSVVTPPEYTVVFTPIYSTKSCSNRDLKAIQLIGPEMSKYLSCGDHCSVRIDEPVCQKNVGSSYYQVKVTAVLTVKADPSLQCSVQCRRDLQASLALLVATNVPQLAKIGVIVLNEGRNKTFLPSRHNPKSIVTHKLKKKDSNGHHEYHGLASNLSPGDVDVVLACPAGFYLMQDKKICATCPANTSSSRGDNVCFERGKATRVSPGARACHSSGPLRRYDWWWYPPCGYLVACGGVGCACGVCAALALLGHVTSRGARASPGGKEGNGGSKKASIVSASARSPHAHPMSPSRVILARFFRPSLTSSRATDSQETKFELWKEKNMPPPLPPIDFDL